MTDPQLTVYPQSGHLSTTDRAHRRESPSAKDWCPNHWARLPTACELHDI